ncbi:MAG TPA: hypothetical protein VEA77_06005 [Hyphomicrobium sp.]|nr:hypothetical protein [Hyphomicrobium sp.]
MTEKSLSQPHLPQAKPRNFTTYTLIWASAALVSLLYLVLLATQPAFVAGLLGANAKSAEADAAHQAIGQAVAEVHSLRETIDLFRNELIEVRAQVSSQTDATRDLMTRVATLETEPATDPKQVAAAAKGAQPPAKGTKAAPDNTAAADPAQKAAAAAAAAKDAAAKKAAAAKAAPAPGLETGSVAQPAVAAAADPITFGPPTVTTTATVPPSTSPVPGRLVGVQIAKGPSVDSLRLSWTLLNERHGESFRALQPRYTMDTTGPDQSYDLVVGPLASADEAKRLCQELAMKATPCTVSRFTGDAL